VDDKKGITLDPGGSVAVEPLLVFLEMSAEFQIE
jgi:hypothetical protein